MHPSSLPVFLCDLAQPLFGAACSSQGSGHTEHAVRAQQPVLSPLLSTLPAVCPPSVPYLRVVFPPFWAAPRPPRQSVFFLLSPHHAAITVPGPAHHGHVTASPGPCDFVPSQRMERRGSRGDLQAPPLTPEHQGEGDCQRSVAACVCPHGVRTDSSVAPVPQSWLSPFT